MSLIGRCAFVGSCVLLSACGAAGGTGAGTTPVPVTVLAPGAATNTGLTGMQVLVGSSGQTTTVGAARDAIWAQLPAAYESLGLPISIKDDAARRIGNDQIKARRAIKGLPMRSIVDCGSDLTGEKAESYDIRLSIATSVAESATAGSADVTTTVTALGRSPNFNNGEISCTSKGELERRIVRFVRVQLLLNER